MSQSVELPINKYLDRYKDMVEIGLKPETGSYEVYTQTVNSSTWAGRNINFTLTNAALNRLILGHRCYLNFTCRATLNNDNPIVTTSPFELRDGAGNLLIESMNISLAGSNVHTDSSATVTRHFYEHLINDNSERLASEHEDRCITQERQAFGFAANTLTNNGIRKSAITDNKRFSIMRSLTDVAFFGCNDSAIPSSLPITVDLRLNSRPGRMFNGSNVDAEPKLIIETVEFYVFSVAMEDALASSLNEKLRTGELMAVSDMWGSRNSGVTVNASDTVISSQNETVLSATPDLVGIVFFPNSSFNPTTVQGGVHPLRSNWLNINSMIIKSGGFPVRYYKNLGVNADSGRKLLLSQELKTINEKNVCPMDLEVYLEGNTSFFPMVIRPIDDMYVLPPKPFSLSFEAQLLAEAGENSSCFYFYKLRYQWLLSSQVAQTRIVK